MRSLLRVPADGPGFDRALRSGADALVLDPGGALALIEAARDAEGRRCLLVRVDAREAGLTDDLAAVMPGAPDGIVLAGAVGGADVQRLGAMLAVWEAELGLEDGATAILAVVGCARGVLAAGTLAGASPRLIGVAWDGDALAASLGAEAARDEAGALIEPCRHARLTALLAAAAAGVPAVDMAHGSDDLVALERECREAERDGFTAKMATHPAQVSVINQVFAAPAERVPRNRPRS